MTKLAETVGARLDRGPDLPIDDVSSELWTWLQSREQHERVLYLLRSLPCEEIERLQAGLAGKPTKPERPSDPLAARLADFSAAVGCDSPEGAAAAWCVAARIPATCGSRHEGLEARRPRGSKTSRPSLAGSQLMLRWE